MLNHQYITADNIEHLRTMPESSVDSIVTDAPYGLGKEPDPVKMLQAWITTGYLEVKGGGFMGRTWDAFVPQPAFWREAIRVLKPGGYVLCFFGTRTYDWGVMSMRIAGFEIRDQIGWIYGSGFPKSHNMDGDRQGWGTALKPAMEPIVVARKPLGEKTVKANVEKHGTGAINIDGCRIEGEPWTWGKQTDIRGGAFNSARPSEGKVLAENVESNPMGRWPANVIYNGDDEAMAIFPESKGQSEDLKGHSKDRKTKTCYGDMKAARDFQKRSDTGSSARFFYCAKPSRAERDAGLEGFEKKEGGMRSETNGQHITRRDGNAPGPVANNHPTVKPIALMRYLVRLVTPPGGTVLDPFGGSGGTAIAAELEGFTAVLIDSEDAYMKISKARTLYHSGQREKPAKRQKAPKAEANDTAIPLF